MVEHLFKEENEEINVQEAFDPGQDRATFEQTLVEMQLYARQTKGNTGIFHVAISPREHESLSPEQEARAIEMIERKFKLSGQARAWIQHIKEGRAHSHVFWSTVDIENGKLIALPLYKRKLQELGRDMEHEFNHEHTPRTPGDKTMEITNADRMIEARNKKQKAQDRKKEITSIWERTETGAAFLEQVRSAGYDVAQGERSRFVLIDHEGNTFNLTRDLPRLVKVKEVRERFGDLYRNLLSVGDAQEQMKDRQYHDRDKENREQQDRIDKAAIEDEKQKIARERLAKLEDKQEPKKPREMIREAGQAPAPVNDNRAGYDDRHLDELDRLRVRESQEQARRYAKEAELRAFYKVEELEKEIKTVEAALANLDTTWGHLSGRYRKEEEELEAARARLENINSRIAEQRGALEAEIRKERAEWEKRHGSDPPVVDLEAERKQRAIEAWKAQEREDPGSRFHERDRGHDLER